MRRCPVLAGLAFLALTVVGCRSTHRTRRPRVAPPPEQTAELEAPTPPPRKADPPRPAPPPPKPKPAERPVDRSVCGPGGKGPRFAVHDVDAADTLNVRTSPDAKAEVLARLPPDATGVIGVGQPRKIGASTWRKVRCGEVVGWVNDRFLDPRGNPPKAPARRL